MKKNALCALAGVSLVGVAFGAVGACGGSISGGANDGGIPDGAVCTAAGPAAIVRQSAIDKVDLLFMIDNSASMGDKQDYLRKAIPDLVKRLVQPNCIDAGHVVGIVDPSGACAQGRPEFMPVHDMHVGIVTSSLGPRLGDVCNPADRTSSGLLKHNDDRGHLVNRATDAEVPQADMMPSSFLAWFPSVPANAGKSPGKGAVPIGDAAKLVQDFTDAIAGVHQLGCGIESQMESWYRFLVQPDPYDHLDVPGGRAAWVDVDGTIIAQRHDFLRPDSAVAIIALSDENDSEIDVRALGQQGWNWMSSGFQPPRGTSACNLNPADPACTSCVLAPNHGAGDPACASPYSAQNDWGYNLNLRHVHMKQKYGVDVEFPIQRYVTGLTSPRVPNRDGEYPAGKADYVGDANCANPLFAAQLPDGSSLDASTLCNLPRGSRTPDMIFYAHIGGVPNELLHYTPGDPGASALTDADWVAILGKDPLHYDYSGIDPHMMESFEPRPGLPAPSSPDNADPISGREWITNANTNFVDLQYACTFPLATPRDCSLIENANICDCPSSVGGLHDQTPPVCGTTVTQQVRAKAYPTIRETLLARLMGTQGILSSICPIHVNDDPQGADPLYGYRPAVASLVDRLGSALSSQCLPQALPTDSNGETTCAVLEVVEGGCNAAIGLVTAPPEREAALRAQLGSSMSATASVCAVKQLGGAELVGASCTQSSAAGFCYVTGAAAGTCPQAIAFSPSGNPTPGSVVSLQCGAVTCH